MNIYADDSTPLYTAPSPTYEESLTHPITSEHKQCSNVSRVTEKSKPTVVPETLAFSTNEVKDDLEESPEKIMPQEGWWCLMENFCFIFCLGLENAPESTMTR